MQWEFAQFAAVICEFHHEWHVHDTSMQKATNGRNLLSLFLLAKEDLLDGTVVH